MTHQIVFTALPHTVTTSPAAPPADRHRVSVFLSFRFVEEAGLRTLGDLDAALSWPELLRSLTLKVVNVDDLAEGGEPRVVASRRLGRPPDAHLWKKLFPPVTSVSSWSVRDVSEESPVTFPVRDALMRVDSLRSSLARTAGRGEREVPDALAGLLGGLRQVRNAAPVGAPAEGERARTEADLWASALSEVGNFYRPARKGKELLEQQYGTHGHTRLPPPTPTLDFYGRVAMLADHPSLLRDLGLVVDLAVDRLPPASGRLRVVVEGDLAPFTPATPLTAFDLARGAFFPAPRPPAAGDAAAVDTGWLRLGDKKRFSAYTVDLDGTFLKLLASADALLEERKGNPDAQPPSFRTGAVTVARSERAMSVVRSKALARESPKDVTLYADDVLRGYRVDVQSHGRWRSLCRRTLHGTVGGAPWAPPEGDVEGYVRGGGGTRDPEACDRLRVHEALFSWDGWSLVVPRPGKVMDESEREGTRAPPPLDLRLTAQVPPNTLPRLRFGETYHLRVRVVDLAGNSLPPDADVPDEQLTRAVTWLRYEPVDAPVIVPAAPFTPGGSLERLVIRSPGGDAPSTDPIAVDRRHLCPPKVSQLMVEQHGMLDPLDPLTAFCVSAREQGALGDTFVIEARGPAYRKLTPDALPKIVASGGVEITPYQIDDGKPAGEVIPLNLPHDLPLVTTRPNPARPGERIPIRGGELEHGQYVIYPGKLEVPWLPDPLALGAVLSLEGAQRLEARIEYPRPRAWPALAPGALVLAAGTLSLKAEGPKLTLTLPPATMLTLKLSTLPDPARLNTLACEEGADRGLLESGRHWMATPAREVTFVHAVERPLHPPAVAGGTGGWQRRAKGDTCAVLEGRLRVHGRSTGRVSIDAQWEERLDPSERTDPAVEFAPHHGHVAVLTVEYGDEEIDLCRTRGAPCADADAVRHELGDTRHHVVRYTLTASTRYQEYFTEALGDPADRFTLSSREAILSIKSSAPPDAPKPLYALPSFRWTREPPAGPLQEGVVRAGRALRVWLAGPWWSSGDGELLAVALSRDGTIAPGAEDCVSRWGVDPRRAKEPSARPPDVDHFPTAVRRGGPFLLPGPQAERRVEVMVAGFKPSFDAERALWYADVEVEFPSTMEAPFVRLALCRWQPESLAGVELSPVVPLEFVQILNDRTASVTWGAERAEVTVSRRPVALGAGRPAGDARPTAQWEPWGGGDFVTVAELQTRSEAGTGDLGWRALASVEPATLDGRRDTSSGEEQWHGALRWLGTSLPKGCRLVVRQFELFEADNAGAGAGAEDGFERGRRLTFAAIFDVRLAS